MNELFNFNDTWILIEHNWVYLLAALLIGAYVGFTSSVPSSSKR